MLYAYHVHVSTSSTTVPDPARGMGYRTNSFLTGVSSLTAH